MMANARVSIRKKQRNKERSSRMSMKKERNKEWLSMKERKTPQSGFYIRRAVLGMVSPKIIAQEIRQLGAGNELSGAVVAQCTVV